MRRIISIILLLFLLAAIIYAEIDYEDYNLGYSHFLLNDNLALYENLAGISYGIYTPPDKISIENYSLIYKNGIPFINKNGEDIFMILYNSEILYLYSVDALNKNFLRPILIGMNTRSEDNIYLSSPRGLLDSSSFLIEGKTEYPAANIKSSLLNSPWVEGVSGNGYGEYLIVELKMNHRENPNFNANGFYFFNGFVSYDKPYLYEYNSRVKKIKVEDMDTKEHWNIDIEDTPNPQYVDMRGHEGHTIKLIIEEVYPGSKWEDTCINTILLAYRN